MTPTELLVVHHSHVDIGYTHPQPVVWDLHDRHLDEAIELCERTADYPEGSRMKWTCEVTGVALHWLESASPAQVERMRRLVADGQIDFGAMLYHWTALQQEDLLRESLLPVRILRDALGARIGVAMQSDVNGLPWSVVGMLLDCGIEHLMMSINIHMGGYPLSRPAVFRWQCPGGRDLLVLSAEHYNAFTREAGLRDLPPGPDSACDPRLDHMARCLRGYFRRLVDKGWSHDFAVLTATHPAMDDNGPPNPELPGIVRRWNESGRTPVIRIVSLAELFERIGRIERTRLPVHGGDWTDFWSSGVGSSALEVGMSRRGHGALWGARALATRLPHDPAREQAIRRVVSALHLANEHTWNVFASTGGLGAGGSGRIEPVPEAEQRFHKSAQCATALSLARMVRRDALDQLAGNPSQAPCADGLLVFNPAEITRRVCLRLPKELVGGAYPLVSGTKHRLDVIEDVLAETGATVWVGPVEVPPLSFRSVPLAGLGDAAESPGQSHGDDFIASPFWRLEFEPESGTVRSLVHMGSGAECFDAAAGFDLFGPVRETVARLSELAREARDPRATFFSATDTTFDESVHADVSGWQTSWPALRARPESTTRVRVRSNIEGVHLDRWLALPGVDGEIRLTISLLGHEERVRFTAFFNKADETAPESIYFTFPFRLPDAQAHFDTGGVVVAFDREQLPGACRGWLTAGSFVAVEAGPADGNAGGCLTLACPDAPLFQIGGFHYGRDLRDARGLNQALLLAWPMNNFWNTNFRASQPGFIRLRYELTRTPAFDPAACSRFAAAASRPVVFHPLAAGIVAPAAGTLVTGLPECVSLVSLKPAGPYALVMVLRNHGRESCAVAPVFPGLTVAAVSLLTPLEEPVQPLGPGAPVVVPGRSAVALRIEFAAAAPSPP